MTVADYETVVALVRQRCWAEGQRVIVFTTGVEERRFRQDVALSLRTSRSHMWRMRRGLATRREIMEFEEGTAAAVKELEAKPLTVVVGLNPDLAAAKDAASEDIYIVSCPTETMVGEFVRRFRTDGDVEAKIDYLLRAAIWGRDILRECEWKTVPGLEVLADFVFGPDGLRWFGSEEGRNAGLSFFRSLLAETVLFRLDWPQRVRAILDVGGEELRIGKSIVYAEMLRKHAGDAEADAAFASLGMDERKYRDVQIGRLKGHDEFLIPMLFGYVRDNMDSVAVYRRKIMKFQDALGRKVGELVDEDGHNLLWYLLFKLCFRQDLTAEDRTLEAKAKILVEQGCSAYRRDKWGMAYGNILDALTGIGDEERARSRRNMLYYP